MQYNAINTKALQWISPLCSLWFSPKKINNRFWSHTLSCCKGCISFDYIVQQLLLIVSTPSFGALWIYFQLCNCAVLLLNTSPVAVKTPVLGSQTLMLCQFSHRIYQQCYIPSIPQLNYVRLAWRQVDVLNPAPGVMGACDLFLPEICTTAASILSH